MPLLHKPQPYFRRAFLAIVRWLARPHLILLIGVVTLLIIILGATAVWISEQARGGEPILTDWVNAFWYMLSTVAGIPVGAKAPLSETGRTIAVVGGVFGSALKGVFTAAVASAFVNRLILEGKGLGEFRLRNHILICGWNNHLKEMAHVLGEEAMGRGIPVVLLADLEDNPVPKTQVRFVRGDPTLEVDLQRASAQHALSAVILADESHGAQDDSSIDARTVLTALALESVNPRIYTVAEVRDPSNRRHFARTKCDEVVASSELAGGLLARTALNPGVGLALSTLMRLDRTAEMYVVPAPPTLIGKSFDEALKTLRERRKGLLVGLARNGDVLLSPEEDQLLVENDRLVMIAHTWPSGLG